MKKSKIEEYKWFVVYSDYGYFTGLANGGQLQWSLDEKEAKPLDGIQKYYKIKELAPPSIDVIFEYI